MGACSMGKAFEGKILLVSFDWILNRSQSLGFSAGEIYSTVPFAIQNLNIYCEGNSKCAPIFFFFK